MMEESSETQDESKAVAELQSITSNPENRKMAYKIACEIQEIIGDRWFSLSRLEVKSKRKKRELMRQLYFIHMFGFLATKTTTELQGGKRVEIPRYKIIPNDSDRVIALQDIQKYYTEELAKVNAEIEKLNGISTKGI